MRFFHVRLRTYAQYESINEFTCSEHSVRTRRSRKRSTGNQPLAVKRKTERWESLWRTKETELIMI